MVKKIFAAQMKSSFSDEMTPYTLLVAATRKLASEYIKNAIWGDTHDIYDTYDFITPDDVPEDVKRNIFGNIIYWEDTILLKRRKTGEIVMYYVDWLNYIY